MAGQPASLAPLAPSDSTAKLVRLGFAGLAAGLAVFAAHSLGVLGATGSDPHPAFDRGLYASLMLGAVALCFARVALVGEDRAAWALIGSGLAAWLAGDIYWMVEISGASDPRSPSLADAGYLALYPLLLAGVLLLLAHRIRRLRASWWLDALLGAAAITAIGATLVLGPVIDATRGWELMEQAATLAFPAGDVFLLAFVGAIVAVGGIRPSRQIAIVIAALAVFAGADAVFSYQDAVGTYVEGTWLDAMWPLAAAMVAFAAWQEPDRALLLPPPGWRSLALPAAFAFAALGVIAWHGVGAGGTVGEAIAGAILVLLVARTIAGFVENHRLLERVRTDPLTGLANRGKLVVDLDDACAAGAERPMTLAYFDLDGFKHYNDSFGHPAGDALLARLGERLRRAIPGGGQVYRVGGDEFCVLVPGHAEEAAAAIAGAGAALHDRGPGFEVSSPHGVAEVPREAATAEAALQLADERLYERKRKAHGSAASQAEAVLLRAMHERTPNLGAHGSGVAVLAMRTGERLGLDPIGLVTLARAAELHDIGKVAIPDALLAKPGPLSDEEWEFMRQHTVLGERILLAAPALSDVARIVRATHERFDGAGYPDGLSGEAIPLASRIIFACDAYDAMTSERPYAAALTPEAARAELRRCAGTQFDPRVVEALCRTLSSLTGGPLAARAAGDRIPALVDDRARIPRANGVPDRKLDANGKPERGGEANGDRPSSQRVRPEPLRGR